MTTRNNDLAVLVANLEKSIPSVHSDERLLNLQQRRQQAKQRIEDIGLRRKAEAAIALQTNEAAVYIATGKIPMLSNAQPDEDDAEVRTLKKALAEIDIREPAVHAEVSSDLISLHKLASISDQLRDDLMARTIDLWRSYRLARRFVVTLERSGLYFVGAIRPGYSPDLEIQVARMARNLSEDGSTIPEADRQQIEVLSGKSSG
jgi:hypothetical protein